MAARPPSAAVAAISDDGDEDLPPPGFPVPFPNLDFDPVEVWLVENPYPLSPMLPVRSSPAAPNGALSPLEPGSDPPASPEAFESGSPIDEKLQKVTLSAANVGDGSSAVPEPEVKPAEEREASKVVERDSDGSGEECSETDSEDSETSSDDSEMSSSSDDDDDDGTKGKMEEDADVEEGEIRDMEREEEVAFWSDNDEGEVMGGPIKSKHETEDLPPVPQIEVALEAHHQTLPVGFVSSILGERVIVEGSVQHNPLNEGSILWITETRSPLGIVDEIFGPVKNPFYIVRCNSDKEVPAGIREGTAISFAMEFASHILNDKDLYKKGYDASGENDEEVPDEVEFSDDEKEAEYKRSLSQTKRGTDDRRQPPEHATANKRFSFNKGAGPRKGMRPPVPPAGIPMNQPQPGAPGSSNTTSMTSTSSNRNHSFRPGQASSTTPMAPEISEAPQAGGLNEPSHQMPQHHPEHGLPSQPNPNALWPFGLPPQQQPSGVLPYGLAPHQQQNAVLLNGLAPQLPLNAIWPASLPLQQQLNGAWPAGLIPPHPPSAIWAQGFPLQQQQNAWVQGFPPPQQQLTSLHGGYFNALQSYHQGDPNQVLNTFGGMPFQQQFVPNLGVPTSVPSPVGPVNPSFGSMNTGSPAQVSFMQAPSKCGNILDQGPSGTANEQSGIQQSQGTILSGMQPRPQFNMGRSSGGGRRPYARGRHSFGRGDRQRTR